MKKTKNKNRLAELDAEIFKLQQERAKLTGIASVPNRLYTDIFNIDSEGSYDGTIPDIDFENTNSLLTALKFMEQNINELKACIMGTTSIQWYGPYHEGDDE